MAESSSGSSPTGIRWIRIPSAAGPIHTVRTQLRKIHSQKIPNHLRPPHPDRLDNVDQENSSRDPYRGCLPKSRRCNTQRVKRNRTSPTAVGAILFCVTKIEDNTAFFVSPEGFRRTAAGTPETRIDLQAATGLTDRVHFRKAYLEPLLAAGWLEMTIPEKPRSSKQRYHITEIGHQIRNQEPRK